VTVHSDGFLAKIREAPRAVFVNHGKHADSRGQEIALICEFPAPETVLNLKGMHSQVVGQHHPWSPPKSSGNPRSARSRLK
jgi:hypothetical protein